MVSRRLFLSAATGAGLALSASGSFGQTAAGGQWRRVRDIPQGANEVIGAAVDGKFLVYGGLSDFVALGLFFMYDPTKDEWTSLPKPPVPVHHGAAVGVGSKFYVFGGFKKPDDGARLWVTQNDTWSFDLVTSKWDKVAPMPTARGALSAVAVGDKAYVIGGAALPTWSRERGFNPNFGGEQSSAIEIYDAKLDSWIKGNAMLTGRNHLNCGVVGGKIFAIGGRVGSAFVGSSTNIGANEEYDIAANTWRPRALMPTPRSGHGVAVLNGLVHTLGGEYVTATSRGTFQTHEAYDPQTNDWKTLTDLPTGRHGYAIATLGDRIYTATGMTTPGTGGGPATGAPVVEVWG